jgi:uncharacterized protein (DUF1778 family)
MGVIMYWDDPLLQVLVSLIEIPEQGNAKVLIRMSDADRAMVTKAARTIEMSQAKFIRTVIVNAARKVLDEMGET